jgi:hypothetical protein
MSQRRFLSLLAVAAFAMTTIFGAMQPSFAEDDEDEPNFMSKVFGAVGLLHLPGPQVDFQERPPLVVPPITPYVQPVVPPPSATTTRQNPWDFNNAPAPQAEPTQQDQRPPRTALTLPTPQEPNSARTRNPDFPIDPEVKAAEKRKKNPKRMFSRAEDDPVYSGRRLTPDEMKAKGTVTSNSSGTNPNANAGQSGVQELNIPSLQKMLPMIGREKHEQPVEFKGEPERQKLTQPPTGYLTPSKSAPYGVVSKDKDGRDNSRFAHPNMPDYAGDISTR